MDLEERISAIVSDENIIKNEDMSRHTTFRTGGPADYFIKITTRAMLSEVLKAFGEAGFTYRRDYYVLGNGSNVLISDKGFKGYILSLTGEFNSAELIDDTHIRAGAGTANAAVAVLARDNALTGFEFAHGIPGTIGGALIMNAGAYGGEMKQVVKSVTAVTTAGETKQFTAEEADFGYRTSFFKGKDLILTDAVIELQKGDKDQIEETMNDLMGRRREKQPLEYPSAGSTFKRPEGHFAGKLIEDAGLKGLSIGGAQVSDKHCGFIINKGDATSADIDRLIKEVQAKVLEDSGIELSPEVIRLGDFEG